MIDDEAAGQTDAERLRLTTGIVAAFVSNNRVSPAEVASLVGSVHAALDALNRSEPAPAEKQKPAVPVSRSVQPDYIVCLEDGARLKMLKRYLRSRFDMSPDDYRRKWGLPHDYPMVAPSYAQRRSEFAKKSGLGRGGRKTR